MKNSILFICIGLFTFCLSQSSRAQMKAKVDHDKKARFLKDYKEYKFVENSSISPDPDGYSSYDQRTVYNAIHDELLWWNMKETETPDLLIYVYALLLNKTESRLEMPSHDNQYVSLNQANNSLVNFDEGTLIIDFVDAKSKKLVWRGSATDVISKNQREVTKTLKMATRRIIGKYPPL